jgi:hypothetical protein
MTIKNRLKKLENPAQAACGNQLGVTITEGEPEPDPSCSGCGAALPVVIIPRKLSLKEWTARDWAAEGLRANA